MTVVGKGWRTPARASVGRRCCGGVGGGSRATPKGRNRGRADAVSGGVVLWGFERARCDWGRWRWRCCRRTRRKVGYARCRMSAFGKSVPIADLDCIVGGRAQARRWLEVRRRRRDRVSIGDVRHGARSGRGGALIWNVGAKVSITIMGAPQCRQTKVGGADVAVSLGSAGGAG